MINDKKNESGKVVKNTLALYVRMIFLTVISLFTYRVVFQCLGASDYGTYNVVGGFVSMFMFVSGTMTIASQRYFALALASDNWKEVNKSFSVNVVIYAILSAAVFLLAETIGLWFVTTKLNLDYSRMNEIIIVYETSIVTFLIGMMVSPFLALLVADENIVVYSWISILEGILKIIVAFFLYFFDGKKLIAYAFLLLMVSFVINGAYILYCYKKYKQLKFQLYNQKEEYTAVFTFVNWNLIGAIAAVGKNQGINVIMNIFFGTVINASRAIAYQINTVISSFAQNFMKAIDPRITKIYANGDERQFTKIIYTSSKISYYLLLIIAIPFIANAEYILTLWLGKVPPYTVQFVNLALIDALVLCITDPFLTAVQAVGNMKMYQLTVGSLSLLNLPISYIALKIFKNPLIPFFIAIVLDLLITFGRLINFKRLHPFSIIEYLYHICLPALVVTVLSALSAIYLFSDADKFNVFVLNVVMCEIILLPLIIFIGLSKTERRVLVRRMSCFRKDANNE